MWMLLLMCHLELAEFFIFVEVVVPIMGEKSSQAQAAVVRYLLIQIQMQGERDSFTFFHKYCSPIL